MNSAISCELSAVSYQLRAGELGLGFWEERDVGLDDAPAFGEADPDLALTAAGSAAFELEGDGCEVAAEGGDLEAGDSAGEPGGGAGFAEGFEFFGAVEIFGDTEAHDLGAGPEHADEGVDVVGDECLLVLRVEGGEFGDDGGVVDGHVIKFEKGRK